MEYQYHGTIKMNLIDVTSCTYSDFKFVSNDIDPNLKVGKQFRKSKYKNIFEKDFTPNWSEEGFVIKKLPYNVPWTYVIEALNIKQIVGAFHEKKLQKTNQT